MLLIEVLLNLQSQPTRAAWIEIPALAEIAPLRIGRSPLGLRGLKSSTTALRLSGVMSQPTRAAWIEIL